MEVRRVSDRVMAVVLVCEENMLWLICGYAPQVEEALRKKSFYDELIGELDMLSICAWATNGHMLAGVMMNLMAFMEGTVQIRGI